MSGMGQMKPAVRSKAEKDASLRAGKKEDVVIKVRGLVNGFNGKIIHDHLDLDVKRGEVLGVVGGSGTGKSVLLRSIVGLNRPLEAASRSSGRRPSAWRRKRCAGCNCIGACCSRKARCSRP
jgi:ABC-type glutathione transport system ATPase component